MRYLLDTSIVLVYLRNGKTRTYLDQEYDLFGPKNLPIVSVVTLGEIESLSLRNNWGEKRLKFVNQFFQKCIIADINAKDVIQMYGEIDAFSQGKLSKKALEMTARNMGKNDLWIAATAAITNSKLITLDKDFAHLHDRYLDLVQIDLIS